MSIFTTSSRIEVDRHRKLVETKCVMVRIIGQVIANEHIGLLTVISLTQKQLQEIGSNKLPSLQWDLDVHLASRMFYYRVTRVTPKRHICHNGLVWSEPTGICPIERGKFSLLIITIGHGDGWAGNLSTEMSSEMQFLDSRSNGHRYFSLRTHEWGDPLYIQRADRQLKPYTW
jgi:hypothetical protein